MKFNYASLIVACFFAYATNTFAHTGMYHDFLNPKDEHRSWIIWQWMDGLVNKEAITKDLEAFKKAGLSGVQNFQIGGDQQEVAERHNKELEDAKHLGAEEEQQKFTNMSWLERLQKK